MESNTMHALCMIREIDGTVSVELATADKVKAWFEAASKDAPKCLSRRLESVFKTLAYTYNKEDLAGAVLNFILSVIKLLDKSNVSEIFQVPDMVKKFLDSLVNKF